MMRVVFDISVLGIGHYQFRARAGVFRYIENLIYGLAASEEYELVFCALESWLAILGALDFLQANTRLNHIPFNFSEPLRFKLLRLLYRNVHRLNRSAGDSRLTGIEYLGIRMLRRPQYEVLKLMTRNPVTYDLAQLRQADLFHSPYFALPDIDAAETKKLKKLLTIHDLAPILIPQFFGQSDQNHYRRIIASLKSQDWVLAISESTKNDLCNYLNLDPSRVFVTYEAASDNFHPCTDVEKIEAVKEKYKIPKGPYLLSVNTLEPRKNMDQALRCFTRLIQESKIDLNYVLVGTKGWDYAKIFDAIAEAGVVKERIILTGYVVDEDLAPLYSSALAFVYPSFYEGFGLPPLEAMQCGVPVITSNTSSLPEVVGDAAIMLEPTDMDGLCQSILVLYNNPSKRAEMSAKSIARAAQFSWERCTQQTIAAYQVALRS